MGQFHWIYGYRSLVGEPVCDTSAQNAAKSNIFNNDIFSFRFEWVRNLCLYNTTKVRLNEAAARLAPLLAKSTVPKSLTINPYGMLWAIANKAAKLTEDDKINHWKQNQYEFRTTASGILFSSLL